MDKVEVLYLSLNIHNKFPELKGIDLDFVRILLMAQDLKINICKCAIASFFKWDKLDQAVGGAQQALGMKLHQQTWKAIAKHQPTLMTAISKFNLYCKQLDSLYDPSCTIPLPTPLPTKLTELRAGPTLMEDMWITPSIGEVPWWLDDMDVRDCICTLLKCDQCREEQVHLGTEADNLCHFFGEELAALKFALCIPECEPFTATLEQCWSDFLQLQSCWSNLLASSLWFATQVKEAVDIAATLSGGSQSTALHWIHTTRLTIPNLDGEDELVSADLNDPPQIGLEQATLTDVLERQMGMLMDNDSESTDIGYDIKATIVWELPKIPSYSHAFQTYFRTPYPTHSWIPYPVHPMHIPSSKTSGLYLLLDSGLHPLPHISQSCFRPAFQIPRSPDHSHPLSEILCLSPFRHLHLSGSQLSLFLSC
ncbi:uncharacterized protein BJ212DRAFT_1486658 [Suillus subaureus]|uniref:Uncharacterized protein n=1 Tax=Suillus subaureus TaxID=48587 RepID=A0A9P7DWC8_9AGAM|nr:uncharacterized protein BJ212DRAFT_1486658 [Suillus subaureus]KAG1804538.1 hypothetical protein BJ212DRAFT_1486658 [Suillus subaureus]